MVREITSGKAESSGGDIQQTGYPAPVSVASKLFQTSQVMVIVLGHFIHDIFTSFLAPLLPLLIEKLSLSLTQAGTLAAFQQIPSLINPILGMLSDRGKLRRLIIWAPSISAIGMCLVGLAPVYAVLALLLFMVGISTAVWHTSTPALVARASGRQIGRGMSYFMIGGSLAYTLGPLIAVAAVSWWQLEGLWRLIPIALAATALLFWQTRSMVGLREDERIAQDSWRSSWMVLRWVLLPAAGILIAQGFMTSAMATYLPTYLTAKGGSLWMAGISLSAYELAGAAGTLYIGSLSDRVDRRWLLAITIISGALLMLLFLNLSGWAGTVVLLATGFTALPTSSVLMALIQENSHEHPATANGIYTAIFFVSKSVITILVGVLADHFGLQTTLITSALIGFMTLPFILKLPGTRFAK